MDDCLVWTENEFQVLETLTDFKDKKAYEWIYLECVKDKYAPILSIFVSNFSTYWGNFSQKIGLLSRSNSFVTNIEKL